MDCTLACRSFLDGLRCDTGWPATREWSIPYGCNKYDAPFRGKSCRRSQGKQSHFGGGEGCTQHVDESFVRKMEGFAQEGKPITSLKGMEWGGEFNLEPKTLGYIAIIVGPDQGRVALVDAGALETRDGRLFLLQDEVFEGAVKLIMAKLDGPNCPFQP